MTYAKGFDEILNNILTDFQNIFPGVDVSQGSLARMKATGYASALWGLYKFQEWISRQIFPDTADADSLEHYGWVRGLPRVAGETDAEYLARLLDFIRRPPAGGNPHDYEMWALEVDGVATAKAIPLAQGGESVDVIITADADMTGADLPDQALLDAVFASIAQVRPVGARFVRVLPPAVIAQDVVMTGVGASLAPKVAESIRAYLAGFGTGVPLFAPQLAMLAMTAGVVNPVVIVPAGMVQPTEREIIRPGVIDVT